MYSEASGYSLIEFLVVLAIMSVVSTAAAGLYLYSKKWVTHWQSNLDVENSAHLLMSRISTDLRYADKVLPVGDSAWIIRRLQADDIMYRVADSSIYRNNLDLLTERAELLQFSMRGGLSLPGQQISSEERIVDVAFRLATPSSSISLASKVGLRQPAPWPEFFQDSSEVRR